MCVIVILGLPRRGVLGPYKMRLEEHERASRAHGAAAHTVATFGGRWVGVRVERSQDRVNCNKDRGRGGPGNERVVWSRVLGGWEGGTTST